MMKLALWASLSTSALFAQIATPQQPPETLRPVSIRVDPRRPTSVDLPASSQPTNYMLVVGSAARGDGASPVVLTAQPVEQAQPLPIDAEPQSASWQRRTRQNRETMEARRRSVDEAMPEHATARFADRRGFYIFVKEDDFQNVANYHEVTAQLVAVGKHCLIYVDEEDQAAGFPQETAAAVIDIYDNHVYPRARQLFGEHRDVDRNGKFTILFTHWLGNLSNGKVSVGGFVRGGDFYRDVEAPFSNQCDMMYLNSDLRPGSHLRTLIAHEYTHAITFSEHVFGSYLPGEGGEDEEAWLNEAISHLAENLMGEGWSNLDYRISTFLTSTSSYRLVVPDYYRAKLWRCHGSRGSTYLFLRWLVDRYGVGLLRELTQSNLGGIANLEAATQTPFEELFRQWTLAVSLDGLIESDQVPHLASLNLRDRLESRLLAGARATRLEVGSTTISLEPTSAATVQVSVPANQAMRVWIESNPAVRLQVTVVRLPDDLSAIELSVATSASKTTGAAQAVLSLAHRSGSPVRWERVSWERASLPQTKTADDVRNAEIVAVDELFSQQVSQPGQAWTSEPIELSGYIQEPMVFKMLGVDGAGRRVAAWAVVGANDKTVTATR